MNLQGTQCKIDLQLGYQARIWRLPSVFCTWLYAWLEWQATLLSVTFLASKRDASAILTSCSSPWRLLTCWHYSLDLWQWLAIWQEIYRSGILGHSCARYYRLSHQLLFSHHHGPLPWYHMIASGILLQFLAKYYSLNRNLQIIYRHWWGLAIPFRNKTGN